MPIICSGTYRCDKCGKDFEWNYFKLKRQKIDSPLFEVERTPHGKLLVNYFRKRDGNIYDVENCPVCDFDNHFPYKKP